MTDQQFKELMEAIDTLRRAVLEGQESLLHSVREGQEAHSKRLLAMIKEVLPAYEEPDQQSEPGRSGS